MKPKLLLFLCLIVSVPVVNAASSEVGAAIIRQFGEAQLANVLLVTAVSNPNDPVQWRVYSKDVYRPGELLMTVVSRTANGWDATPAGAGKLLQRTPSKSIDFKRLKVDAKEASRIATDAARLAQKNFASASYQLAANETTGAPEWGLALQSADGVEIGFCVISAETGALQHQDWTLDVAESSAAPKTRAEREGEAAARKVKQGVRKAWNWTEEAGRKTGGFFRELFR